MKKSFKIPIEWVNTYGDSNSARFENPNLPNYILFLEFSEGDYPFHMEKINPSSRFPFKTGVYNCYKTANLCIKSEIK